LVGEMLFRAIFRVNMIQKNPVHTK